VSAEGDVVIRKLRGALAEEGFADVPMCEDGTRLPTGQPRIRTVRRVNPEAWWIACSLVYGGHNACWHCYITPGIDGRDCARGNCHAGPNDPKFPPRLARRS
jgi:hypothetical protein